MVKDTGSIKEKSKTIASQTVVVILAAGKGSRMGRNDLAKVCFEIDSVPAINRTIRTFRRVGFENFMLVVGANAEQVMDTVNKEHPSVSYVYQSPQLGTGHAAKLAAETLSGLGHQGYMLVSMGDKFIEPEAIEILRDGFIRQNADLALLSIPRTKDTESQGKILTDSDGQALDIIESADLSRLTIAEKLKKAIKGKKRVPSKDIIKLIENHIPVENKRRSSVPELLKLTTEKKTIAVKDLSAVLDLSKFSLTIAGKKLTASQIDKRCKHVNPSLYYFKAQAYYDGVAMLTNDNAQGEYYITDIVRELSCPRADKQQGRKVRVIAAHDANMVQGFNSPDELLRIQDNLQNKKSSRKGYSLKHTKPQLPAKQYKTVRQWITKIESGIPSFKRWLRTIYGDHQELHQSKIKDLLAVLECYGKRFGFDEKVCIVRAPGRVNLMGRHIDHRGGCNNFLAINRETIAVAGRRNDDNVAAVNVNKKEFGAVDFSISQLIGRFGWTEWINFVDSDWVRSMLRSSAGDWGNYIKAAMLRLQHNYYDLKIQGLNMAFSGDIPIAAGLSSSSSIVVATLEAAISLNNLELDTRQFVDLCGEGEWFVGSRGGSGDHAAICLGQRGKITHVGYLPFRIKKVFEAPPDCQVIIADSHIKAKKSSSARDHFNAQVAASNLGLALLRHRCPKFRDRLQHVRDIKPSALGILPSQLYEILKTIPQSMTREELTAALGDNHKELLEVNFSSHKDPGTYNIRGVLLFGAAETARSELCPELLGNGELSKFGHLMKISHEGDRVSIINSNGNYSRYDDFYKDSYLDALKSDLISESPAQVAAAQLEMQPGYYACSTPKIDKMVDLACSVSGVVGAQLAGAGLGGCIMILAKKTAVDSVCKKLIKEYYKPEKLKPALLACTTVQGASLADF